MSDRIVYWGKQLKAARQKRGMTRQQLADKLQCSYFCIRYWERGEREMSLLDAEEAFNAVGLVLNVVENDHAT